MIFPSLFVETFHGLFTLMPHQAGLMVAHPLFCLGKGIMGGRIALVAISPGRIVADHYGESRNSRRSSLHQRRRAESVGPVIREIGFAQRKARILVISS